MSENEKEDSASKWNTELEFAQITDKTDFFYQKYGKIKVYGGGEDGQKREHNPPHFHVELNDNSSVIIRIPETLADEVEVLCGDWDSTLMEDLRKWFLLPFKFDNSRNNYETVKIFWNGLNDGDDTVQKI